MLMKIVAATGAAALVATAPAHAQTHTQAPADHWTFSITPYLWLPNVNGTLNYSAPPGVQASPQVEVGPNDYLSDLKAAALIAGEAEKGPWAIFTDVMYLKFDSQDSQVKGIDFVSVGRNPVNSSLNLGTSSELEGTVWTLAGSYSLLDKHPGALSVLGGFRYFGLDASTDWNLTATITAPGGSATFPRSGSVSDSVNLWDAIVGLRGKIRFGESAWSVLVLRRRRCGHGEQLDLPVAGRAELRLALGRSDPGVPGALLRPERRQARAEPALQRTGAGTDLPLLIGRSPTSSHAWRTCRRTADENRQPKNRAVFQGNHLVYVTAQP